MASTTAADQMVWTMYRGVGEVTTYLDYGWYGRLPRKSEQALVEPVTYHVGVGGLTRIVVEDPGPEEVEYEE